MKRVQELKKEYGNTFRVAWFLALRQIKRSGKGTTALIVFIMVLTFLNLVVVSGLLVGLISGSFQQFKENYSGDVIITSAPGRDYIENSQALVSFLENHPEVTAISPRYTTGGQVLGTLNDLPNKNERPNRIGSRLVGINVEKEQVLTGFSKSLMEGTMLRSDESGYILVGANLLKKYSSFADANIPGLDLLSDVDIGSRVRVTISTTEGAISKDFIVKGIVKSKVDEISTRMFVTDSDLKRLIPVHKEQYQEIAVRVKPTASPELLVSQAKSYMGNFAARIQTSEEAIPSFLRDIESTFAILGNALSSIALVVASITIFIVVFINAVTRRKFIGIMKGIGISPQAIQISYVLQALFYGITGSIIGLFLTFVILKPYFAANPINFPFSDGILVATPEGAAIRVTILLVVTLLAGYIPAKIIARKNTLDSILGR